MKSTLSEPHTVLIDAIPHAFVDTNSIPDTAVSLGNQAVRI